jgi:hypothetical protein
MSIRLIAAASTGVTLALVLGGGTAHADPPGNTPNDPINARAFCVDVANNPTPSGMAVAVAHLSQQLDTDDTVDGAAYGLLYVCPEYRSLFSQTYNIYGPPHNNA